MTGTNAPTQYIDSNQKIAGSLTTTEIMDRAKKMKSAAKKRNKYCCKR